MDDDDDDQLEDVSRTQTQFFTFDDDDVEEEEAPGSSQHGYSLQRHHIAPIPPWRADKESLRNPIYLTPRQDPNMGVRARSVYDELTATVQNPKLTLTPSRGLRTTTGMQGVESPLENLLQNIMSNVAPQELSRVVQHATGRPLVVLNEGGTMLAASSSGFMEYPIGAAALTPLNELLRTPEEVSPPGGRAVRQEP